MYFLNISSDSISNQEDQWEDVFSPFVLNTPFLYTLKASENRKVFWCSQGVDKGCIGEIKNLWLFLFFSVSYSFPEKCN